MKSYGHMMGYEWNGHENVIRLEFNGCSWDIKNKPLVGVSLAIDLIFGTGWLKRDSQKELSSSPIFPTDPR